MLYRAVNECHHRLAAVFFCVEQPTNDNSKAIKGTAKVIFLRWRDLTLVKLEYERFYCLQQGINKDTDENDGRSGRDVQQIAERQARQTVYPTQQDAVCDDSLVAVCKQIGRHLWNGQQTDGQDYSYHSQRGDDGNGDQYHHHVLNGRHGELLRTGEARIEGYAQDRTKEQREYGEQRQAKHGEQQQVSAGNG